MKQIVAVAGASGQLGEKIVNALVRLGAEVHALVRTNSDPRKLKKFEQAGVKIFKIRNWNVEELALACKDAVCVVSVLAGLRDVVIDAQKTLLDAAVAAGVPRFIPSDYSLDFTKFKDGENRNLDLRREFHTYLDKAPIAATTIFNGAFADMLTGQMPLILFKQKMVLYWGDGDHRWDFTTMDNVAEYTAHAAIDKTTPRYLRIAGDQISVKEVKKEVSDVTGDTYRLFRAGGKGLLSFIIKVSRTVSPGEDELYPAWQGMQYMRNMIDERSKIDKLDNVRYPDIKWTTVRDVLTDFNKSKAE